MLEHFRELPRSGDEYQMSQLHFQATVGQEKVNLQNILLYVKGHITQTVLTV